jgi:hypothetical protein
MKDLPGEDLIDLAPSPRELAVAAEIVRQSRKMQKRGDAVTIRRGKGDTRHLTRSQQIMHRHIE